MTDEPHLISRAAESHMQTTFARIRAHHNMPPHVTDQQLLDIIDSCGGRYAIRVDDSAFAALAARERTIAEAARAGYTASTIREYNSIPRSVPDSAIIDAIHKVQASDDLLTLGHPAFRALAKVKVTTIDLTPTWSSMLPILITLIEEGRNTTLAKDELKRMARLADLYVDSQKGQG